MSFTPVHYKPYDEEPTACGLEEPTGKITDHDDDVTCVDCQWELR